MSDILVRADLELLVRNFYQKAMKDALIGDFFTKVAKLDLEAHIPLITDFWENVLFHHAKYKGNPMLKHIQLNEKKAMEAAHFERWLGLWEETVQENFEGKRADETILRSKQIATLMQMKIGIPVE